MRAFATVCVIILTDNTQSVKKYFSPQAVASLKGLPGRDLAFLPGSIPAATPP